MWWGTLDHITCDAQVRLLLLCRRFVTGQAGPVLLLRILPLPLGQRPLVGLLLQPRQVMRALQVRRSWDAAWSGAGACGGGARPAGGQDIDGREAVEGRPAHEHLECSREVWELLGLGSRRVQTTRGSSVQGRAVLGHSACALVISGGGGMVVVPICVDGV